MVTTSPLRLTDELDLPSTGDGVIRLVAFLSVVLTLIVAPFAVLLSLVT